jgi:beta-lactamase class A
MTPPNRPFHATNLLAGLLLLASMSLAPAQTDNVAATWPPQASASLQALLDSSVQKTLEAFAAKKLGANELAVTLIDLRDAKNPALASYRGNEQIYPASVIKLFYLVAAHRWLEDGKLQDTEELRRALHDMIVYSYNEATHYVIDLLTDTTSGPELPQAAIETWFDKRNAVNRYFAGRGYNNINANKKPWCEGPYGRETQAIKLFTPKRNMLTTDATARLMLEIFTGQAVSANRCEQMKKLMERNPFKKPADTGEPDQGYDFNGPAIPAGSKVWSKAGWTSETRHDAACIELANGARFILVTFTVNHAGEREIIPSISRTIIAGMK